ncbi:GGDEF domain-containing protein [Fundidesulfovibrio terrae]|uniref:GGDEF domain-containing protein n=1 Tax=Fundidesulfovibrio terrae TaxID=2922866 RepID=UPI0024360CDC|nr:GGDEF domain-containing protein [Fundidesulfovibrio terrae]
MPDIALPRLRTWWSDRIIAMRRDKRRTALLGVLYLLGIGWLDYVTGFEINLTVVYVTPLIMLTVAGGWRIGLATAIACALTTEGADYLAGRRFDENIYHLYSVVSHSLSYLSFLLLITQLLMLYDQERDLAGRDPLTGLRNRYGFLARAEEALRQCARDKRTAVLFVVNVATLRQINAAHGHDKADALLLSVADVLREIYPGTVLGRLGGDRFAALEAPCGNGKDQGTQGPGALHAALEAVAQKLGVEVNPRRAEAALAPLHRTPDEVAAQLDALLDKAR